jgi:galactose mutarotase-like enzyme
MPTAGRIAHGPYKDQDAVILENDTVRAVLLPAHGGKTISLVHKGTGVETLWQNPLPRFTESRYGDPYERGEFAGFDEMFPTVSRCFYQSYPWAGVEAPDHGEVWALPWDEKIEGNAVTLGVNGVRFPYRLQKTVSLEGERLVAHYSAANLSRLPLEFIWAAHPLFNASEGMRFIVPADMRRIVNAVPGSVLGGYGERYDFPVARRTTGSTVRLDQVPARNSTGYQKYWFESKVSEGWCILHDPRTKLSIGLTYPPDKVPYLGMWLNEGGYAGQYNIAPEPATAAMDRIDFATMWGMGSSLAPGGTHEWDLVISLGQGGEPRAMSRDGGFVR